MFLWYVILIFTLNCFLFVDLRLLRSNSCKSVHLLVFKPYLIAFKPLI